MKYPSRASSSQCKQRPARKLDRKKVIELHAKGLSTEEIAKHQGVAPSTVWRFLQQTEPERQGVEHFKKNRADVLARLQAKSLDAQERIINTLDDAIISALTPSQKSGMLIALNAQSGTVYDKERLERGQSTANISTLSRMIDSRVGSLYTRNPLIDKQSANPDESGS